MDKTNAQFDEEKIKKDYAEMADTSGHVKFAVWALVIFFGGFLLWAIFVPLDEGVPLAGTVVVDTKRKAVQHPSGGVIKEIFVREGQFIKKGDSLLKLSDSNLTNELVIEEKTIESLKEAISTYFTNIKTNDDMISSRLIQKQLLVQELEGITNLVKEGYAPKVKQLALERELNQLESSVTQLQNDTRKNKQSISELRYRLEAAEEKIPIIKRKINGTLITANFSGQVIGLKQQSIGGVVKAADRIMDIIPEDEELVIEAQVKPHVIDRVKVLDIVDIRFSSFSKSPMLVLEGKVNSISADILYGQKGEPYYLARINITESGRAKLAGRKMQPGMQAQVIIKTGTRTLLSYILHPLTRRLASSMIEE